jgi:hypothetical protein
VRRFVQWWMQHSEKIHVLEGTEGREDSCIGGK